MGIQPWGGDMNSRISSFNIFDAIVARDEKYRMAGIVADIDYVMNELLVDFQGDFVQMNFEDIVAIPIPSCQDSKKMDAQIFSDRKRFSDVLAAAIVNKNHLIASGLIQKQFPDMDFIDISRFLGRLNEL